VRIQSFDELRPGFCGIPEPPAEAEDAGAGEISLAIVPCVTVTASGLRLGHGGGYYDHFLCRKDCEALCLCYAEMLAESLPEEPWDVRMDGVLTEKGYLRCQSER
jgi:5-formyltetrahydrofolate cyclo-ligase